MIGPSQRRRSSAATSSSPSVVTVPQPSRDLSFRKGAYTKNILRLEQSAEAMSADGSDIGEEIRRLNEAEKELSRQNSILSSHQGDFNHGSAAPYLSRHSSHASAINDNARAGLLAEDLVTSPTGSVHSRRTSLHRRISSSSKRNSRLANMMDSSFEYRPLELTLSYDPASNAPSRQLSQVSYGRGDDGAAQHIHSPQLLSPTSSSFGMLQTPSSFDRPISLEQVQEHRQSMFGNGQDTDLLDAAATSPPPRPSSTDTFQQAQIAFQDFDGVHYSPDLDSMSQLDPESRRVSKRMSSATLLSRPASMMPLIEQIPEPARMSMAAPPPPEGMVYYPAPVPRMLNLPKRLSQLPAATTQARRRTSQPLSALSPAARNSAAWLGQSMAIEETEEGATEEMKPEGRPKMARFSSVPAQLRASTYFEHPSIQQNVELKAESAVATLDSILAASATLPASAFTDHPYAGDISKAAFAPEKLARRSTANDLRQSMAGQDLTKGRRGSFGNLLRRASSNNVLDTVEDDRRVSQAPTSNLRTRASQMSLGNALDDDAIEEEDEEESKSAHRMSTMILTNDETIQQDFRDETDLEDIEVDEDDPDAMFAEPSTLLAELQVRKAQLKSRNRTAATAFPNGMHSTLLELDAVAQIDKKKRANQRIALAWEDPNLKELDAAHNAEDDDVPLGMMFPNKNGLLHRKMGDDGDWDRPLGLMEKREMEDNEPLSSRRSRLRGEPIRRPQKLVPNIVTDLAENEDGEDGDESLAYRQKRLSTKNALDAAISDVAPQDGSRPLSTFTDEVIGQLTLEGGGESPAVTPSKEEPENETLGQRRARLQREREERPALQKQNSMSNLLAANPVGERKSSRHHAPVRGTLLFANEQAQADHKRSMLNTNTRTTSFGQPLAQSQSMVSMPGMLPQQNAWATAGMYSNMGMQTSASMPMFAQAGSYFPTMQYPIQPMQPGMVNPLAYGMLTGQQPYPAYPQQMAYNPAMAYAGLGTDQASHQQRAAIDRWRMSVAR